MRKEHGVRTAYPVKPVSCTFGPMDEPLEFAARPANDIEIDPPQSWTQLRPVEVAVVGDPAANDRIIDRGQLFEGFVATVMQRPAADFPADAHQRLRAGGGHEAVREDTATLLHPHRLPGTELEAQKVERDDRKIAAPVYILAVDDLRLFRMQYQAWFLWRLRLRSCNLVEVRVPYAGGYTVAKSAHGYEARLRTGASSADIARRQLEQRSLQEQANAVRAALTDLWAEDRV